MANTFLALLIGANVSLNNSCEAFSYIYDSMSLFFFEVEEEAETSKEEKMK